MAAHDDVTVTIDTDEMTYVDLRGFNHVIDDAQTWTFDLTARGSSEVYNVIAGASLSTGNTNLGIEADPAFSEFTVSANATAELEAGSITFVEPWNSNERHPYQITTVTIDDIDEPTDMDITLTSKRNPEWTIVMTGITLSQ